MADPVTENVPVNEPVVEVTEEATEEAVEEAVEEAAEEAAEEVAEEVTEEVTEDIQSEEESIPVVIDVETEEDEAEEEAPSPVAETELEPDNDDDEEAEETVTIIAADIPNDEDKVVPIVISDDDGDEAAEEEPITLADDSDEDAGEDKKVYSGVDGNRVYVTYDYSFRSKLIQSSEEVQSRYAIISDTLQSYGLKLRESWKKERYYAKGNTYANMIFRGKTLCVCLAIAPESLEGTKYFYENVGNVKKYESVPVMVRVRSGRGCKYALELIKMMLEGAGFAQKRPVSDTFTFHKAEDRMALIEKGYIKVMMTNGEGEPIAADFEAMKNLKFNLSAGMPILKRVTVEEAAAIPDAEVESFIETEAVEEEAITGRRKGIINIDTISDSYKDGDTVTLQSLIAKKLVAKNIGFVKILARGALDKALTVKANDFSIDAAKMIVIAGGSVIKLKTQK